jgi:hypothetical protein
VPVAEYTVAAILFANKRVLNTGDEYARFRGRAADWHARLAAAGNYHRRVGIVGASGIGRRVIALLRGFDVQILLSDPYLEPDEADRLGARLTGLPELFEACDTIVRPLDVGRNSRPPEATCEIRVLGVRGFMPHARSPRSRARVSCTGCAAAGTTSSRSSANPSTASRSGTASIGATSRRPNTAYRDAAWTSPSSTNSRYSRARKLRADLRILEPEVP